MSHDIEAPGVDLACAGTENETVLSSAERALLAEAVERLGEVRVARLLHVARGTQARALAGLRLWPSVATCIRLRLPALQRAAA